MSARIISVSGPPGAGKSTLLRGLAAEIGGTVIAYDDYEVVTRWPPHQVVSWLDAGAPFDAVVAPGLADALATRAGLVFLETPFGRACPATGPMIAASVWLECPDDVALARKLSALARHSQGNKAFADFIVNWLHAYETFTRRALAVQRARVKPKADIEIDVLAAPQVCLSRILLALKDYL